jgi:16S rRNA C967 or C1407 C5-methylase (RsmB/RsmF family)/NOL1/NOP2/fmu family ribosome biogenesis protein
MDEKMNLPVEFAALTRALLGEEEYRGLVTALAEAAPVSIRLNPFKRNKVSPPLSEESFEPVPWCDKGYYLDHRPTFTFDPLFHAGCYYVQEASSMFLEQVMRQYVGDPVCMLDLCAAPGGKATHVRSVLPAGSLLVANEVIRSRSRILVENVTKWGHPDVVVTHNDPADFKELEGFFDVILADVPCSGEGMFRKDPDAIRAWSPGNVEVCRQRQRRIVADIWPCLKPGGLLIYSTCTYNIKENEENVSWIMEEFGAEALHVDVPVEWNVTGNLFNDAFPVYRFLPHKTKGEGFFLAVLRKEEGKLPGRTGDREAILHKRLRVIKPSGVEPGTYKGKDIIPSHAQAMSLTLQSGLYPVCELTYEQAIAYLRREAVVPDASVPRGYVLVTYRSIPLGFVKNVCNRANNLYPQDWRIRSTYLPDEISVL